MSLKHEQQHSCEGFNQLIADVYQLANHHPVEGFQAAVLNRFNDVVPLDTAFWMTRSELDTPYEAEETYTHNLPSGVQDNYIKHPTVFEQALKLNQVLAANMGQTIDVKSIMPQSEWEQSDMYLLHCKKYDIEHSVMTLYPSDHNQMIASISLNRKAANQPFSEEERVMIQYFVPHMVEAQRINIICHMRKLCHHNRVKGTVDKHGRIIEADSNFVSLLNSYQLHREQQVDLFAIQQFQEDKNACLWDWKIQQVSGLFYIDAIKKPLYRMLTGNKLKTAQLLANGKSNKFIAFELDLSIETINEYVGEIYKVLNVGSRYEAIGQLLSLRNQFNDE